MIIRSASALGLLLLLLSPLLPVGSDAGELAVRYAFFDGTAWIMETVGNSSNGHTSLALDAADRPRLRFECGDGYTGEWLLRHAALDGMSWQLETLARGNALVGESSSLVLAGWPYWRFLPLMPNPSYAPRGGL